MGHNPWYTLDMALQSLRRRTVLYARRRRHGGETGAGFDTMAIPWTSLFVGAGIAIHATFWHNDFGTPKSHGCVNALPEDAKWIFRWTSPQVAYNPGDVTNNTYEGTRIEVIEPQY